MFKFNIYLSIIFPKKDSKMVISPLNDERSINDLIDSTDNFTHAIEYLNSGAKKLLKNRNLKLVYYFLFALFLLPLYIFSTIVINIFLINSYFSSKKSNNRLMKALDRVTDKSKLGEEELGRIKRLLESSQSILEKIYSLPEIPKFFNIILPFIWYISAEKKQLLKLELKLRLIIHPEINEIPLNYNEILELRECLKDFDLPKYYEEVA